MKVEKRYKYENRNKKPNLNVNNDLKSNEEKLEKLKSNDVVDKVYGFSCGDGATRCGWLMNMKTSDVADDAGRAVSAVDLFFLEEDGGRFKASVAVRPYLYLGTLPACEAEVASFLSKKYGGLAALLEVVEKEDLDLNNHLSGLKRKYIKFSVSTVDDLVKVKKDLLSRVISNKKREEKKSVYTNLMAEHLGGGVEKDDSNRGFETLDKIVDIREHDVPYLVRASIDLALFVGTWYDVQGSHYSTKVTQRPDLVDRPDAVVLAYDIETTKLPLKFPDSSFDQIMMISYMVDGLGYLICNRELISADIEDFEFTPRAEFPGPFIVFNEADERQTLLRFFDHVREVRPNVIVTYNGDSFDWPFVETRATVYGLDLNEQLGFERDSQGDYKSRCVLHMDCYKWVQRDSYLPVGSQGLKAVCKAKLHYDPVEVDPEEMCTLARDQPRTLANYSVSDAVATYYLYMKYVHPFIFALCTIIPLEPDEVLRKGSGTLCESLLMVQAHKVNIIFPNKQDQKYNELTADGHLLESETYVGGHVEAIESGVFRADIATKFRLVPEMCQSLRASLIETFTHALIVEEKVDMESVSNFEEVIAKVDKNLQSLQEVPNRLECPVIYHLDVAAMYPNIILSNRLQPSAVMDESAKNCASCDHNGPSAKCKRPMKWVWRGEVMPASKSEYYLIQSQLEKEKFPPKVPGEPQRSFYELSREEKAAHERDRLGKYCRKAYKKTHITREEERTSIVCQKENSFYVDTVRSFRDRRYEFKDLTKVWKKTLDKLTSSNGDSTEIKRASGMLVLYDSLQLAHKCILNSFYGYVMRRGARWYSMEMAGIVCNTGAAIIKSAREIIEQIGRPLELDTDGIWCILPSSFPENVTFQTTDARRPTITVSYPGAMLNVMVQTMFTNDQYHELVDPVTRRYNIKSENSIFFEVDGPYKAMILPASKEQGKKLKKRYAVFNFDNSLAELKGFEVKRNGELNLIKIFQSSVFEAFLKGTNLKEVYDSVAVVADRWLDLLHSKGANTSDEELLDLISEKRCMSKKLAEYGKQKSTCISTARRLAEFLGDEMVKDAGLSFRFIISKKPEGLTVTERAIPLAIFQAESSLKRYYLRKWLKIPNLEEVDLREILDWDYYIDRFNSNVQKIITIPAAFQHVLNPVSRVLHPDWLHKKLMEKEDTFKQRKINDMFTPVSRPPLPDMEGMTISRKRLPSPVKSSRWQDQILLSKPPRKDTKLWLQYHKKKWEIQREIKSRPVASTKTILGRDFHSLLKRRKQTIIDETWEIIQIAESSAASPGIFKLWTLIAGQLYSFKLNVLRTFYVNTRYPKDIEENNSLFKKVAYKVLPRSHSVHHLYEYNMEESMFIKYKGDIFSEFVKNEVEGLYELSVPLMFRALIKVGCLNSVDKNHYKKDYVDNTFELRDLRLQTTAKDAYLKNQLFKKIFLFRHKSGTNEVISVFFPALNKAHLYIIEPKKLGNYIRYEKDISAEYKRRSKAHLDVDMTFKVSGESSEQNCFKSINKLLLSHKSDMKYPTMVVIMSNVITSEKLSSNMSALNDFPCVLLQHTDSDTAFNVAFNWQELALRCALNAFINYDNVLQQQVERARYLDVPVGNLYIFDQCEVSERFKGMTSCDLLFARHLTRSDHVLWCSKVVEPDLGGKEVVDRRQLLLDNDIPIIQHNKAGSYATVSVQLDMTYVIINAIIATDKIQDIDGSNSAIFDSLSTLPKAMDDIFYDPRNINYNLTSSASNYDDTIAAAPAFKILRKLFLEWIHDVKEHNNSVADDHIINFYKWLRSPKCLLYDPALYKTLQKLMRKLFFKLIEQMSNLGMDVVFGNMNKVVLCTKKTDLAEALLHVEYATKAIRNQEIFSLIDFQYAKSWEYLLWDDCSNFCGIKADIHSLSDESLYQELSFLDLSNHNSEMFSADIRDPARLDIELHLRRYLSPDPVIQVRFIELLSEFMFSVWFILKDEYNRGRLERAQPSESQHEYSSLSMGHDASVYPTSIQNIDIFLQTEMTEKLYSFMMTVTDSPKYFKVASLNVDDTVMPLLPLQRPLAQYPLVDFINTLCHILSLDKAASNYTKDWKRNMFKVLGYNEYCEYAIWRSPYSKDFKVLREVPDKGELLVVAPEVICTNCNMVRDVDFCRDKHCVRVNDIWGFICPGCDKPYNKEDIETVLAEQLNNLVEAALLQDLRCSKCQYGIMETVLSSTKNCKKCGNGLQCSRSSELVEQQVAVYEDLAKYYQLDYLKTVSSWILKGVEN